MKPSRFHVPVDARFPLKGMNTLMPEEGDPSFSPNMLNMDVVDGYVRSRRGLEAMVIEDALESGEVLLGVFEFEQIDGTKRLCAIGTKQQYTWEDTGGGVFKWRDDRTDPATDWTGGASDYLSQCVGVDGSDDKRWAFITNGNDIPKMWDGDVGSTVWDRVTDGVDRAPASLASARAMQVFYDRLFYANFNTGSDFKQNVIWCAAGDFTDWTGTGSGEALIADARGDLVHMRQLAERLVIYAENSIHTATFVGGDILFAFEKIMDDSNLVHGNTVVSIGPFHAFMTNENVMLFDGSRLLRPVANAISPFIRENYNPENSHYCFGFHDAPNRKVFWVLPSIGLSYLIVGQYNLSDIRDITWTVHRYGVQPVGLSRYTRVTSGLRWSEASGPWVTSPGSWGSHGTKKGSTTRVLARADAVFIYDDSQFQDDGTDISTTHDTVKFTVPDVYKSLKGRFLEIEFEAKGNSVKVQYSVDSGSFSAEETVTLGNEWDRAVVYCDKVGRTFQVRFNSDVPWELRWVRVWLVEAGV